MPKVSIIIPTYNSGKTVKNALESVYRQSFQDWECIIVDGASKDNTINIVKEYSDKDARFRYISEKDHGIYDAFNKGWRLAEGDWIHYLGSDDSLTVDGLEKVAAELDDKFAVVTGDVFLKRANGTLREQEHHGMFGCHQGVLMQRKVFEEMQGFDEQYRIIADYELLVRVKKAGYDAKNVRAVIAVFSIGGESQKLSSQWEKMWERYRINKKYGVKKLPFLSSMIDFLTLSITSVIRGN